MQLIRNIEEIPDHCRGGAVTIGNFDGVHRGHVRIIQQLKQWAVSLHGPAVVFTFDPHPACILRPEMAPVPLTWIDRKADLLSEIGVDAVVAYPTNRALLELSYDQFFERVVRSQLGAKAVVEGPNFCFGRRREGTIEELQTLCARQAIELSIVQPLLDGDTYISSSRIRELIRLGRVDAAAHLLTHPYRIRGLVAHGHARGAELGFPTANLEAIDTLLPGFGIYAGRAYIDHRLHWAAIHVGPSPTFGDRIAKVEIHILDFAESLYGQVLEVDFVRRLRDIRQFESADALRAQVQRDVDLTRSVAQEQLP